MIKSILLLLVLLVGGVLIYAATRPDTFRVERSIAIQAPPEKVFPLIDDFHNWPGWSPWEKMDPAMKKTHAGAPNGKGASYAWEGNDKVGQGRMEITESKTPSKVVIKLDFIKPFEGHNIAEFDVRGGTSGTSVTWAMHGPSPYIAKLMGVFVSMDKMIGKDFEAGLANMKTLAEK